MLKGKIIVSGVTSLAIVSGCFLESKVPYFPDWPQINSAIKKDPEIESRVAEILAQMTLEEKVGQMIQPDLRSVTPEEAKEYKLGSILNGGGGWPDGNKYATAQDWAEEADKYYLALEEAYAERGFRIPFMWATDAVHGHNNVFKATVFPHNIGLGAANNPKLIKQIGKATAREVAATGLDWTFAPTVATPRDYRWGRVYEGYSEDPEIVYQYAGKMVEGLQGGVKGLKSERHVISNVKHWLGDGGTTDGVDRGMNEYSEEYLRNIHATGYFSGLDAGAQVVMTSFNSWYNDSNYDVMGTDNYNKKLHGSKYIVNDVLKDKMGFDGLVVTDWNGHSEINGCTAGNCPQAVLAGNDIFMVTARKDWQAFYHNVIDQVNDGIIPMTRIDDAVTRILRVKMRAGLWKKPQPSLRRLAGKQDILGSDAHRELARKAVSQSLVLLKNKDKALPLSTKKQYLVVGSAVNDIQKQTGGWSLTWQGTENTLERDFPGATTMLMAMQAQVGEENVFTDVSSAPKGVTAVVVIGEDPYAEMFGDINKTKTLEYATLKSSYGTDLRLIKSLKDQGFKVITVFFSGRPLYVNEEINHSDAFVAAWLPGTEAGGITDVLFGVDDKDFRGRLSFSWPKTKCSTTINRKAPNLVSYETPEMEQDIEGDHAPLFAYGYGLSYNKRKSSKLKTDLDNLPLDPREYGCGLDAPDDGIATTNLEIFGRSADDEFTPRIAGSSNGWVGETVSNGTPTTIGSITTTPIDHLHQQDAVNVKFTGEAPAQIYMQTADEQVTDKQSYLNSDATLQFDIDMKSTAPQSMILATHCEWPCLGQVPIHKVLPAPSGQNETKWTTIKIPLQCFADEGMAFQILNTPFLIYSDGEVEFNLGEIRYVPRSLDAAEDAITCEALKVPVEPPLEGGLIDIWQTWEPNINTWQARTDTWEGLTDHVVVTGNDPSDTTHEFTVTYDAASPEYYKGLVLVQGKTLNLSNFTSGNLTFDIYIETYGEPSNPGETQTEELVVKMESTAGSGNDYPLGSLTTGQWHAISVPVAELNTGALDITKVNTPFATLSDWNASQAGVVYRIRNIKLEQ
ncbi:glycoside hydrolase family 3 protein [Grimontia sp. NTOU-MAR1]|uniref:glycoside hydrolase family 3 protein n=1 Tax=Grimontia sp. NTOU-MAR1 TaxID=3111011 RepID=UPI002DB6EAA1|nr:glycoside hydrolase family 3 N-terminal domain-containing protein [Grimontia sp. NTOU-MAR1]WRV98680.1 glycoside hydrolase family 3 N-terminal domain-containing protein [Grimontia sp. NTOU-MAR1]